MREKVTPSDHTTDRSWYRWRAMRFVLLVAVGVIVLLVAFPRAGNDGEPPSQPEGGGPAEAGQDTLDWSEELDHIEVTARDFRADWNRLVDELDFGHELQPFAFDHERRRMGVEAQRFPDGSELEVVEHPDGYVSRMELRGEPTDVDEAADYVAMVYALIHATSGMGTDEVRAFAGAELGLDETLDATNHSEQGDLGGVAYEADAFQGQWLVWAGSAHDAR
ncbi:hypothetical protein ER308_10610 [Egibacter rhizosphaerae]|uniref:Uncharacterized protein n=1 Tax=Egibacter rhizosphaerae TaxID=1670831 RepID=A0A411YFK3_9ACTN|nr:hypothetical protein [Egibacter rhizosphaerae]QBI19966.1 hypothetical protein ER308_10610 [Egibacter rhizosphaerae]